MTAREPEAEISEKVWRYCTPLERLFLLSMVKILVLISMR
jgi:hypothetical protein